MTTMLNFANYKWETPFSWHHVLESEDLPLNEDYASSARCVVGDTQLAVFRSTDNKLFALQNLCGHRIAFVLSEGSLGIDQATQSTYVTCPLHRRKFFLDGNHKGSTKPSTAKGHSIATFDVKEENGQIWVYLPEVSELDSVLGTHRWMPQRSTNSRLKGPINVAHAPRSSKSLDNPASCTATCGTNDSKPSNSEESVPPECASEDSTACHQRSTSEAESGTPDSASSSSKQQGHGEESHVCPIAKAQQALCW